MESEAKPQKTRRRLIAAVVLIFGVTAVFLPNLIGATGLRNVLANHFISGHGYTASIDGASASWLARVEADGVIVARTGGDLSLSVQNAQTSESTWNLISSVPDFGHVVLNQPHLVLDLSRASPGSENSNDDAVATSFPTFSAAIEDGRITVLNSSGSSPIDIRNLNASLHLRDAADGPVLVMDRTQLFDHLKLTPEMCDHGLQLIAPVLSDVATVEGDFSLELTHVRMPLNSDDALQSGELMGRLRLHQVLCAARSPFLVEVTALIEQLTGFAATRDVKVLDDSWIEFEVRNGEVFHQGLTLLLPELSEDLRIETSGVVSLDEQLDLDLIVVLPEKWTRDIPILSRLTAEPLEFRVVGTIADPEIRFPEDRDLIDELAGRLNPGGASAGKPTVEGAVGDLLQSLGTTGEGEPDVEQAAGSILKLIQAIRNQARSDEPPPEE